MYNILKQAEKVLLPEKFKLFKFNFERGIEIRCIFIVAQAYSDALDELIKNALNDSCDPIVVNHFKQMYQLQENLKKYDYDSRP